MFPQVQSVFLNWTSTVQMQIVEKEAVDFEMQPDILNIKTFEAVIQAQKPQVVQRKPENLRIWKWWDMWTTEFIPSDTVIQDPDGIRYRVQSTNDWSQGGFYHAELTEQPNDLDQV